MIFSIKILIYQNNLKQTYKKNDVFMQCILCQSKFVKTFWQKVDSRYGNREYRKCANCNLIFLSPEFRLGPNNEKAIYDQHQNSPENAGYVQFLRNLADPLSLKLWSGAAGLDFGCGPVPTLSVILNKNGYSVDVYDPYYFPNSEILTSRFDFITTTEVVEHFYDPAKEFLLIDRLLKNKRGYFGLMTQLIESEESFPEWWYHRDPTHVCFYQKKTFKWVAEWMNWNIEFPKKNVIIFSKY